MTDLTKLLQTAGVFKALVIDDAYDEEPFASDLAADIEAWNIFFSDLQAEDHVALASFYPAFAALDEEILRVSEDFVPTLWRNRASLRNELVEPLFRRYETLKKLDREIVDKLVDYLKTLGLQCVTCGRTFIEKANDADLIFIDLFLNSAQQEADIHHSIDGLAKVIEKRKGNHPLVALMSNSPRLAAKRREFQDKADLFESCFRIIPKSDLSKSQVLNGLLVRLSTHFKDSKKVIEFVDAWKSGLGKAQKRTTDLMRQMTLSDISQINSLLLDFEEEPTGSFLVDVFDKVLQHEIEGESSIIDAARVLNGISKGSYPPPYVPNSPELQDLVYRSLFQNASRLRLAGSVHSIVAFGDVLRRVPQTAPPAAFNTAEAVVEAVQTPEEIDAATFIKLLLRDVNPTKVLGVMTPACDLQRMGAKKVMLLVGSLVDLTAEGWKYNSKNRTPIIIMADGKKKAVEWDVDHVETLSQRELSLILSGVAPAFELIARMREAHGLEIQQKLLAHLGRVGLAAPMPATFPMRLEIGIVDSTGAYKRLNIPSLESGNTCYIGRDKKANQVQTLVLTDSACEAIYDAISSLQKENIHPKAHQNFDNVLNSGVLLKRLESPIPMPSSEQWTDLKLGDTKVGIMRRGLLAEKQAIEAKWLPNCKRPAIPS